MLKKVLRKRPSASMVVAVTALVVATTGSAVAATLISSSKQIKKGVVNSGDVKNNSLKSKDIKNGSLLGADFKPGEIPAGPKGDKGDTGATGAKGDKGDKGDTGEPGPLVQTLPSGKTLTGSWNFGDTATAAGQVAEGSISFPFPTATGVAVTVLQQGDAPTANCPGTVLAPKAAPGRLCIYTRFSYGQGNVGYYGTDEATQTAPRHGVAVYGFSTGAGTHEAAGTWAVTAP